MEYTKVFSSPRQPTSNRYALLALVSYPLLHVANAHTCTSGQLFPGTAARYFDPRNSFTLYLSRSAAMGRFFSRFWLLVFPAAFAASAWAQAPHHIEEASSRSANAAAAKVLPVAKNNVFGVFAVSSKSAEARKLVENAFDQYENVLLEQSITSASHATEKDPHFALAYAMVAFASRRSEPNPAARQKARELAKSAPAEEQLLVRWLTSVEDVNLLPAIASMNDLLAKYPNDKHVLYLTSEWLYFQQDYDRSRAMMEKILTIDPNFPPACNMLGYSYVETGNPDPVKAINYLKKYAELQPNQPNPEDSLGEVSRYAGDDAGSLEHYARALKIIPNFITSQIGLGDTSTLMGNYARAREEYDKATPMATKARDTFHIAYQRALVHFWEGKLADGLRALDSLAAKATEAKEPYAVYEISLGRALLTADPPEQAKHLEALETKFSAPVSGMSEGDRNPFLAEILRDETRIQFQQGHSDAAQAAIKKLETLASASRDLIVSGDYESALGLFQLQKNDFAGAVDGLSADEHSPLMLQQLALAQEKSGDVAGAESTRTRLKYMRGPTVEWFLVTHPAVTSAGSAAD
jgi:predicted Zn-dependent protease